MRRSQSEWDNPYLLRWRKHQLRLALIALGIALAVMVVVGGIGMLGFVSTNRVNLENMIVVVTFPLTLGLGIGAFAFVLMRNHIRMR